MIDGLAFTGLRATWNLAHSAMPDAPLLPQAARRRRRGIVRPPVAATLRRTAERLDPIGGPRVVYR